MTTWAQRASAPKKPAQAAPTVNVGKGKTGGGGNVKAGSPTTTEKSPLAPSPTNTTPTPSAQPPQPAPSPVANGPAIPNTTSARPKSPEAAVKTPMSFAAILAKGNLPAQNAASAGGNAPQQAAAEGQVNGKASVSKGTSHVNGKHSGKEARHKDTQSRQSASGNGEAVQFKGALKNKLHSVNAPTKRMSFGSFDSEEAPNGASATANAPRAASPQEASPVTSPVDAPASVAPSAVKDAPTATAASTAATSTPAAATPVSSTAPTTLSHQPKPVSAVAARAVPVQPSIPRTMSAPPTMKQGSKAPAVGQVQGQPSGTTAAGEVHHAVPVTGVSAPGPGQVSPVTPMQQPVSQPHVHPVHPAAHHAQTHTPHHPQFHQPTAQHHHPQHHHQQLHAATHQQAHTYAPRHQQHMRPPAMPNAAPYVKQYKPHGVAPNAHMAAISQPGVPHQMLGPTPISGPNPTAMYAYVQGVPQYYASYYDPQMPYTQFTPAYMQYPPQMMPQGGMPSTPTGQRFTGPNHAPTTPTSTPGSARNSKARVPVTIKRPDTDEPVQLPQATTASSPAPRTSAPAIQPKVETPKSKIRIVLKNPETGEEILNIKGEEAQKKEDDVVIKSEKNEDTPVAEVKETPQPEVPAAVLKEADESLPTAEAKPVAKDKVPAKVDTDEAKKPEVVQISKPETKEQPKPLPSKEVIEDVSAEPAKVTPPAPIPTQGAESSTESKDLAPSQDAEPALPKEDVEKVPDSKKEEKIEVPKEEQVIRKEVVSVEDSAVAKAEVPEAAKPAEPVEPELEDGEIAEDDGAKESAPKPEVQTIDDAETIATSEDGPTDGDLRRSASPLIDEEVTKPTGSKGELPSKIDTRPAMKRLESFEGVKYPSTVPSPSHEPGKPFRYQRDFLLQFAEIAKEKPQGLPAHSDIYGDDKGTSPRGDRKDSKGPGRPLSMSRQGSSSDVRMGPPGKTSEERWQQAMASKHGGVGVQGVMSGVAPPPTARMSRTGSGGGGRMPPMMRQGSFRDGVQSGRDNRSGRGGRERGPPRHAAPEPLGEPVEPLVKSESAWAPMSAKKTVKKPVDGEDKEKAEEDLIYRKTKGLLNKLTIERFDSISSQILNIGMTRESILKGVIAHIFEKALDEPNFGSMYASLCARLSSELPKVQSWIDLDAKNNTFRRVLLNRCQEEFEKGAKWSESEEKLLEQRREARTRLEAMTDEEKLKIAEEDYQRGKTKRRVLGNIRFIGELFIQSLITEKIMHQCIQQLLKNVTDPEEEDVESLCKLLTTIGARMDHSKAKGHFEAYFARIEELTKNVKLSARIRFMLLDLIDLRKEGWKARNAPTGPKTIAEIRAEAERKQAEEAQKIQERNRSSGGGRGMPTRDQQFRDRRGGGRGSQDGRSGGVAQVSGDGWVTQGSARGMPQASRQVETFANFGQIKKADRTSITFGPGGGMGFGQGAKGWGAKKTEAKEAGAPLSRSSSAGEGGLAAPNMFSVLEGMDRKKSVDEGRKPTAPKAAAPTKDEELPKEEEVKRLTKGQAGTKFDGILEEWFSLLDVNEVILSLKELGADEYHSDFVDSLLNKSWEKKPDVIKKSVKLLLKLLDEGLVTSEDLKDILAPHVEFIDDMAIDVPDQYKNAGHLLGRLVASDALTLHTVLELSAPLLSISSMKPPGARLLAEILKDIKSLEGDNGLVDIVTKDSVDLKEWWPKEKRTDEILADWLDANGLFVLAPELETLKGLKWRLGKDNVETVAAWLKEPTNDTVRESPEFVRILTIGALSHVASQTVFPNGPNKPVDPTPESVQKQKEMLTAFKPLFDPYIDGSKKVDVLFAIQAYCGDIGFPTELLPNMFRHFREVGIVDKSAFEAWKEDTLREQSTKKEALAAVGDMS
ncbi:hypothetical protein SpCBS45565_g03917 [Spizellomyces sp. 'palustris']|nr:hypothetical protein SpCBS45565_g03917 [Spizellomyces sp. 'palustris']